MEFDTKTREFSFLYTDPPTHIDTAQSNTCDKTSFAFFSARDRWPVIIVSNVTTCTDQARHMLTIAQTGAIDDVHRATSAETNPEKQEEGKKITQGLATLKYELQHNRKLT